MSERFTWNDLPAISYRQFWRRAFLASLKHRRYRLAWLALRRWLQLEIIYLWRQVI